MMVINLFVDVKTLSTKKSEMGDEYLTFDFLFLIFVFDFL